MNPVTRTSSNELMRLFAKPSKVASALDWRKSTGGAIATLDVHADRIGVRIWSHPEQRDERTRRLPSQYSLPVSPKGRSRIPTSTRQQLSDLVHNHKVCGFVVSWPLQKDTGLMGAACGRTLFAMEELLRSDKGESDEDSTASPANHRATARPVFLPSRPLCLWDASSHHYQPAQAAPTTDAFGRSPLYARTTDKTEHVASKEQYHQDESIVVSKIWEDFVQTHWPDLDREQQGQRPPKRLSRETNNNNSNSNNNAGKIWDGAGASSSSHPQHHQQQQQSSWQGTLITA